jgi:hypothetical protein
MFAESERQRAHLASYSACLFGLELNEKQLELNEKQLELVGSESQLELDNW